MKIISILLIIHVVPLTGVLSQTTTQDTNLAAPYSLSGNSNDKSGNCDHLLT